jgi:MFS transporter, ACS family, solute carrier family 17 (sodium-dependent inorganic phosphate cotransporter), other
MFPDWSVRRSLMVTLAVAWFLSYADRVNMSVAAIPMQAEFGWDETTKGLVLGSVFVGYLSSQLIGGWLADKFGATRMLTYSVLAFSVLTLLTPLAAEISFATLITARIALGVAEGLAVPATYAFIGRWSPPGEVSRLLAIVVSGATIGAPGGLMLSGLLVEHYSWQSPFYVFGMLGVFWALYWKLRAHEAPAQHPGISLEERALFGQEETDEDKVVVPMRRIVTHPAVWALIINKFASLWMVYVFLGWLPSYFNSVQGISIAGSGLFAALPWIAMSLMLYVASARADGLLAGGKSIDFVRKLFQVMGLGGAMVFLLLIPLADTAMLALVATSLAMAALGCCYSGADPTVLEMAPRYRGFLTGLVGTIGGLPGVIAIPLIGWLVDTTGSYNWGFISAALLNVIAIVVWLALGTGRKVID